MREIIGRYGTALAGLTLIVFFVAFAPNFATTMNIVNVLKDTSFLAILALGFALAFTVAELDLSIAEMASLAAVVCGWRPDGHGIREIRFAEPTAADDTREPDGGLRATVGFAGGRNRLTIAEQPGFAAAANAVAADVATKLLADHGLQPADVDLVAANPLTLSFLDGLAERLGIERSKMAEPPGGPRSHTAGLGLALAAATAGGRLDERTVLLVSAGAGPVAGAALLC